MARGGDEIPMRDWLRGVAVVVALVGVAVLIVVAVVNAQCNCLTRA